MSEFEAQADALLRGAEQALQQARDNGWTVVSVRDDWATVF